MRGGLTEIGSPAGLANRLVRGAALLALAAMGLFLPGNAEAETRTLKIYHVHLNEHSEITYKRNGRYLSDGLNKLNRAVRDWRRNEPTKMDPKLFDLIWEVYRKSGGRGYVNVIGGYRSPATNSMLRKRSNGVAEKSQHIRGKAMDFYIPGVSLKKLRDAGLRAQVGGVGYYPSSGSPFVHMDVGNVRHWPRLSRRELMALFPDGKTVHVPTDGKPLAGYDVALASTKARKAKGDTIVTSKESSSERPKSLLAALFGGGADEEEDQETAVAVVAAKPKPVKKQAAPVDPLPLPDEPQPAIVAALPRRQQAEEADAPRPGADVGEAPEALAFAVPTPNRKPKFVAVQKAVAEPSQDEIAAAIANGNGVAAVIPASVDPEAEAAAIRSALGQDLPKQEEPFLAGAVPVPGRKPKTPEVMLASVAVPETRPQIEGLDAAAPADGVAAMASAELVDPDAASDAEAIVASVPATRPSAAVQAATLRTAMLKNGSAEIDAGVKTTSKSAKPKQVDAKPGMKTKAMKLTPQVGKFALNSAPVAIENQPVAPEYAQALVRAAPTEVYVAGFTQDGPLPADKFSGKAVNFLRIAKFQSQ
jgi:uncharacterized protein YcbK (DUF882 family)